MSAVSAQRRLSFPVRKSSRQRRTDSVSSLKLEEVDSSPLRRSRRNSARASALAVPEETSDSCKALSSIKTEDPVLSVPATPERRQRKGQRSAADSSSTCISPSKRKSDTVSSPPTPPKSPCKSATKVSEDTDVKKACIPKPPATPKRSSIAPSLVSPVKNKGVPQNALSSVNSPRRTVRPFLLGAASPLRSPTKRKCENVPPPPTPPKSPAIVSSRSEASVLSSPKRLQENRPPTSPRKSVQGATSVCSPKKSSTSENAENFVLKSPKKPVGRLHVSRPDSKPYQSTKQLLHTAKPDLLVGRDREVSEIKGFLETHLEKKSAGSLYISGAPGTGKTAALLHIIDHCKAEHNCIIGYLNCMTVKDSTSVFRKLHAELSGKASSASKTLKDMEKLLTTSKDSLILVLDEIDQLDSKNQEVLYTIFEWPYLRNSKLILIGVANALDLTDRILPRLQAKPHCRPALLHFAPYTRDQIAAIITNRLTQCQGGEAIIENSAIQFCARKVSAVAGDMRKALDVCRRAVELVEAEIRSQQVLRVADCNSPSKNQPVVKKIGIPHISKVLSEVYGSSVQAQQSEGVPLQQKLMVCTLLLVVKSGKFKEVHLGKVYEHYCKVCKRQQMAPVDQSEFHSLCVLLEARGIIGMKKAKDTRMIKLTLRQDEKELEQTLQDRVLVSTIIKEGLPK